MSSALANLFEKIDRRLPGIRLYGIAPPKRANDPEALARIAARQAERVRDLPIDGLVVYDLQDESERTSAPRPFPFLPTVDPEVYADVHLREVRVPKVVYRAVHGQSRAHVTEWLDRLAASSSPRASVLVGAPAKWSAGRGFGLSEAYALVRERAPKLYLGGITIAERHGRSQREHERILEKEDQGCRFFVSQAVYDVTASKSLLSDLALACESAGRAPPPIVVTLSPCGSVRTLELMQWLGIAFPRWLENDLRHAGDILEKSMRLCTTILAELVEYAAEKRLPLGVNVESVSIRQAEIDASVELVALTQKLLDRAS